MARSMEFFATKEDLLGILRLIEEGVPLCYVRWGYYPEPTASEYLTAADVPELGSPTQPRKGADRYLVLSGSGPVTFRQVDRTSLETVFETQPPEYASWVHLHSGGLFGDQCLVEGIIETAVTDRELLQLFGTVSRAIRKHFDRIESTNMGSSYVGPEAAELLRGGMRFVRNSASSPRNLDFKVSRK